MDSPFLYNKYVTGQRFIGRKEDCTILGNLLSQSENVVIWEPYGTGKKSIVHQVLTKMRVSGMRFTTGDITALDIRHSEVFIKRLGAAVIRLAASTPDEYAAVVAKYLAGTHFVFDREAFSSSDTILSTNWDLDRDDFKAVLRLPYSIAADRREKMFMIVDEFQNLDLAEDGEDLFKLMEGAIDEARLAGNKFFSYIFLGSQYNAMQDIFVKRHFFYRRVERLKLSKVDERAIVEHIIKGFLASGKVVDRDLVSGACRLFRCNLFYINHFTSICDSLSKGYIMEPVLLEALETIISIHRGRFIATMNDLTTFQVSLLKAIIDGYTKFSTAEVIRKYSLNSSANVRRLKDALMKKEILTFVGDDEKPLIFDPLFEYWLRNTYFKRN
ncbi:MAG: ATP-binding protein [Bacteroidales bacterium]|nr:ATP-binding protein [Bacteroidales bacterium]